MRWLYSPGWSNWVRVRGPRLHRVSYNTCLVWELFNSTKRGRSRVLEYLLEGGDKFKAQKEPPEDSHFSRFLEATQPALKDWIQYNRSYENVLFLLNLHRFTGFLSSTNLTLLYQALPDDACTEPAVRAPRLVPRLVLGGSRTTVSRQLQSNPPNGDCLRYGQWVSMQPGWEHRREDIRNTLDVLPSSWKAALD